MELSTNSDVSSLQIHVDLVSKNMIADHTFQKMTFMYEREKILVEISILKH